MKGTSQCIHPQTWASQRSPGDCRHAPPANDATEVCRPATHISPLAHTHSLAATLSHPGTLLSDQNYKANSVSHTWPFCPLSLRTTGKITNTALPCSAACRGLGPGEQRWIQPPAPAPPSCTFSNYVTLCRLFGCLGATVTKHPKLSAFNDRNSSAHDSGWKTKINVSAGSFQGCEGALFQVSQPRVAGGLLAISGIP